MLSPFTNGANKFLLERFTKRKIHTTWTGISNGDITNVALKVIINSTFPLNCCCMYANQNCYLWEEVRKVGCFLYERLTYTALTVKCIRSGRPSGEISFGLLFTCDTLYVIAQLYDLRLEKYLQKFEARPLLLNKYLSDFKTKIRYLCSVTKRVLQRMRSSASSFSVQYPPSLRSSVSYLSLPWFQASAAA
jgi:hypothetical protein